MARARKAPDQRAKSPWVNAILAVLFITAPSWRLPLLGLFRLYHCFLTSMIAKGKKGLGLQGQKPLGQCYLGSAVHYRAILAVTPTGILSFVALLTNKYDGKGQKGLGLQGQKPLG